MKILLVDDDTIVVKTMLETFPWMDCGITEIRTAWSVKQAKEVLNKERIDILLCDIEMPMATGIELIEWIKAELGYSVVIILLTCHSEFQYTQRAIQLGCSNYLLKPVEESELKQAILIAEEQVVEQQRQEKERRRREQKIHNIDAVWEALLAHRIDGGEKLQRVCEEYEVDKKQEYRQVLITVKHHSFRMRDVSRSLMSFILENVIREVFQGEKLALVNNYNEELGLFFQKQEHSCIEWDVDDSGNEVYLLKEKLEEIEQWMQKTYGCALACYIGRQCPLEEWKREYEQLKEADERFTVSPYVYLPKEIRRKQQFTFECPDMIKNNFQNLFSTEKYETLLQLMKEYFTSLTPDQCSVVSLRATVRRLDLEFEKRLQGKELEKFREQQSRLFQENPDYVRSIPGVMEYYQRLFEKLQDMKAKDQTEPIMDRVKLFISMNMQQDIRREDVAAHVGLNPDYLNRIFKKEMGISIKEYIAEEKIHMACELLEQTGLLIGEIGEMVGYVNFSSFSTFFKNRTGMTPAAWRKEHEKC